LFSIDLYACKAVFVVAILQILMHLQ